MDRFEVILGDITKQHVDTIVNAANTSLLGGGGVDGAIHRAAGPGLVEECRGLNGCHTGEAKLTGGYSLPARHVVHTVGPVWRSGNNGECELLAACYRHSLSLADQYGLRTIAFPSISTGRYSYPLDKAAAIAVRTILDFLGENNSVEKVFMVCFDDVTCDAYRAALAACRRNHI